MPPPSPDYDQLALDIKTWARELGFQRAGITDTELSDHETHLLNWLEKGFHGSMEYMARHGTRRSRPGELVPGTCRIVSVRMDYLPPGADPVSLLDHASAGYVSRYALGRDYHKVMRRRLQQLADRIQQQVGPFGYRAFVDSAPVLEKALAEKAGLGWIGKHSNLLSQDCGSWFFLGELYTDLPLPADRPSSDHCGSCSRCIEACPTQAIVAPFQVDARRCISYLTIENRGTIPEEFRQAMGNRIYGCDDCQLVCPFNRFAEESGETDFTPRWGLDQPDLVALFGWTRQQFLDRMEGSPIRRIGYESWLRNIAVGLGNADTCDRVIAALTSRAEDPSRLVREHVSWALARHGRSVGQAPDST